MATEVISGTVVSAHQVNVLFRGDGSAWHLTDLLDQQLKRQGAIRAALVCHLQPDLFGVFVPSRGWQLVSSTEWKSKYLTPLPTFVYMGGWAVLDCLKSKSGRQIMHKLSHHDVIYALRSAGMKIPAKMKNIR